MSEVQVEKKLEKDLTEGSPLKLIIAFAIPMILGNLFQQLYNFVDTMIVGHFLGVDALAGVGATGSINFLIVGCCIGICSGFAIPVSQMYGAKQYEVMRRYIANTIYLSVAFSVVITVTVSILCKNILDFMNTPENIINYSYVYILTIFLGIPVTFFYNVLAGIIRAVGDSKTPLVCLVVSTFINVGLDIVFISVFKWGIFGAAFATVLSQLMSGILCLYVVIKNFPVLHIKKNEWTVEANLMKKLCSMGLPMGLQYSITAIGSVLLQTSVNSLGSIAVAANTTGGKVNMLFLCILDALGGSMATYGGQNLGAGRVDRIREGVKVAGLIGVSYSILAFVLALFVRKPLISLFLDTPNPKLLEMASMCVLITIGALPFLVFVNVLRFLIQGVGFSKLALFAGFFEMIARTIAAIFFIPAIGYIGSCIASPFAWVLADAFLFPAYFSIMKKLENQIKSSKIKEASI